MKTVDTSSRSHDRFRFMRCGLAILITLLCLGLLLSACSPPENVELPELEPGRWHAITFDDGAQETMCADGSDYRFYIYPGTVNKLVIDFQGGGACWSSGTCSRPQSQSSKDDPSLGFYRPAVSGPPGGEGIYNENKAANPVGNWYHLFISYCTADVHLGDNEWRYPTDTGGVTIHHKGQNNVNAALNWAFNNFSAPETILMTGCSAGAYASLVYTPLIREHYPHAGVYQLGDSGAGVLGDDFVDRKGDGLRRWRVEDLLLDVGLEPSDIYNPDLFTTLYTRIAQTYADSQFTQYNSKLDPVQIVFYALQSGLDPELLLSGDANDELANYAFEWAGRMDESLRKIAEDTSNFHSYISLLDEDDNLFTGTLHCIINRPEFYTYSIGDVAFVDWFTKLINGRQLVSVQSSERLEPSQADELRLY